MSKSLQITNKEPLFHMVKRDTISIKKAWSIRIIALFFALITCAIFGYYMALFRWILVILWTLPPDTWLARFATNNYKRYEDNYD